MKQSIEFTKHLSFYLFRTIKVTGSYEVCVDYKLFTTNLIY